MGRYRKNPFNRWYSRPAEQPSAPIHPLWRYDRPKIPKINYLKSHAFQPLLAWEPARGANGSDSVHGEELIGLLKQATRVGDGLNWKQLLQPRPFTAAAPTKPAMPPRPEPLNLPTIAPARLKPLPPEPVKGVVDLRPTLVQRLIPSLFNRALRKAEVKAHEYHQSDHAAWEERVASIQRKNDAALRAHEKAKEQQLMAPEALDHAHAVKHWLEQARLLEEEFQTTQASWAAAKDKFESQAAAERELIASLHERYVMRERDAIALVTTLVLRASRYPDAFPRSFEVQYKPENRIVVVNFQLPDFQAIEIVREKKKLGQKERTQLQEQTLHAIAIRTLYEVIAADQVEAFASVVFNGWVHFIDGASGHPRDAIILSVHATRDQIAGLNIAQVDPVECFRALKGIAAKRISAYTPVAPILVLNKEDDRLVEGREVLQGLSAGDNLAAIDWETFEHLVREVFAKEFSKPGMEVRITRASRDRGVDAIVFDPDPIRGGKFVIQAKKYTNTVDVSSVRDLFGTVQAEGANRGILVTTSQFGPDAYEFAKDKNISLMDGNNLLHLFEKHGYSFRIDLAEARKIASENTAT
jgi:restriction system protein